MTETKEPLKYGSRVADACGGVGTVIAVEPDRVRIRFDNRIGVQGSWMPRNKVKQLQESKA